MRVAPEIVLTDDEHAELLRLVQSRLTSPRVVDRARIVLLAAQGMQNKDIAAELDVGRVQVSRWRERYSHYGLPGIERDLPRGTAPVDVARRLEPAARPTVEVGVQRSSGTGAARGRASPANGPLPRRADGPNPSPPDDARSSRGSTADSRIEDIVGLYVAPHAHVLVLRCDDTGSATMAAAAGVDASHMAPDFLLHDTTTFCGTLKLLDGQDMVERTEVLRQKDLVKFLGRISRTTPNGKSLLVITDTKAIDEHPAVRKWLSQHGRFRVATGAADSTWPDNVEQFLGTIDANAIAPDAFANVPELLAAIEAFTSRHSPGQPVFVWTQGVHAVRREPSRAAQAPDTHADSGSTPLKPASRTAPDSEARAGGDGDTLRDSVITLKRDRILQEAAKLFFERGYLQTSVDAIAERLGATKPFVYYHFNSKIDMLIEICERSIRDALAAAENAMSTHGSPRVRLEQFLREFTNVALQQHQLVAIYFREEISLPKEAAHRLNLMRKAIGRRLSSLLAEGIKTGDFQIEDPRMAALVIAGMSSYAFAWYREDGRLDQEEVTNRIVRMALKLVSASDQHRPSYRVHARTAA